MKWAQKLLTDEEVDKRVSVLQKHINIRSFPAGFSRFQQHTGREERELQRSFVGIIAGHPRISENIMKAFRSLLDYIYIAQYDSQSTATLQLLRDNIRKFHRNKGYLSCAGIRDGSRMKGSFKIPKLELLHNPPRQIPHLGSAPQFSADYTERLHIDNAKIPYKQTNRRDHDEQICRWLDRRDKMNLFSSFIDWEKCGDATDEEDIDGAARAVGDDDSNYRSDSDSYSENGEIDNDSDTASTDSPSTPDPSSLVAQQVRLRQLHRFQALILESGKYIPKPAKDKFADLKPNSARTVIKNDTTVFALTARITHRKKSIADVSRIYRLPGLLDAILSFYGCQEVFRLPFNVLDCWDRVRMQLRMFQDHNVAAPPSTVTAIPPSDKLLFGLCNFVLVRDRQDCWFRGIQSGGTST